MSKHSTLLPINAMYFTWLRDFGKDNRPTATRQTYNRRTKLKRTITKNGMDLIDFAIYVSLLSRADKKKLTCFPSLRVIGRDCFGLEERTISDHLSDLEQMGFIEINRRNGRASEYFMKDFHEWLKNPRHKD